MMETQEIPYGYCHCGCGQKTNIITKNHTKSGLVKGEPRRYIYQHHLIGETEDKCPSWKGGQSKIGDYKTLYAPDNPGGHRKYVLEHRLVAEKALGHYLPPTAVVHHIDGNKHNNEPSNLVVCENKSYHNLIHRRKRALDACGNADYLRCKFCGKYDSPLNIISIKDGRTYHKECAAQYARERLHRKCQTMM